MVFHYLIGSNKTDAIMKNYFALLLSFVLTIQFVNSQDVTTHEYRHVSQENMEEYLKRETTYYSKLAESEIKKGNLTYWLRRYLPDYRDLAGHPALQVG